MTQSGCQLDLILFKCLTYYAAKLHKSILLRTQDLRTKDPLGAHSAKDDKSPAPPVNRLVPPHLRSHGPRRARPPRPAMHVPHRFGGLGNWEWWKLLNHSKSSRGFQFHRKSHPKIMYACIFLLYSYLIIYRSCYVQYGCGYIYLQRLVPLLIHDYSIVCGQERLAAMHCARFIIRFN